MVRKNKKVRTKSDTARHAQEFASPLEPGLYSSVHGLDKHVFPDFTKECEDVLTAFRKDPSQLSINPFLNNQQVLTDIIETLATQNHRGIIVGEEGIEVRAMMDYVVRVLTDRSPEFQKTVPVDSERVKQAQYRFDTIKKYSYLHLPNLENPSQVITLSYDQHDLATKETNIITEFYNDIIDEFVDALKHPNRFHTSVKKHDYEQYVSGKINELYSQIYDGILKTLKRSQKTKTKTKAKTRETGKRKTLLDEIVVTPELVFDTDLHLTLKFPENIEDYSSYVSAGKTVAEHLHAAIFSDALKKKVSAFKTYLMGLHVEDLNDEEKMRYIKGNLGSFLKSHIGQQEELRAGTKSYEQIIEKLSVNNDHPIHARSGTDAVVELVDHLKTIKKEYERKIQTHGLKEWMNSVIHYFDSDIKRLGIKIDESIGEKEKELYIQHGSKRRPLSEVLSANFDAYIPDSKPVKSVMLDKHALLAAFESGDDTDIIPHLAILHAGTLIRSHPVILPNAGEFMTAASDPDENDRNILGTFTHLAQESELLISHKGNIYRMKADMMLIGSDIKDPFFVEFGSYHRDLNILRETIQRFSIPTLVPSTRETRRDSIAMIIGKLDALNTQNSATVDITPEAINMILSGTINRDNIMSVHYGNLENEMQKLRVYALANGTAIDASMIRKKKKESIPRDVFALIDPQKMHREYFDLPIKTPGIVHGLTVYDDRRGYLSRAETTHSLNERGEQIQFELAEIKSKMLDRNMVKGYELARNFATNRILQELKNSSPAVRKQFYENSRHLKVTTFWLNEWMDDSGDDLEDYGGPSGSGVINISALSYISETPIFRNRMMTGTVNPADGTIHRIGLPHIKAHVPLRIRQLSLEQGIDEPAYFLFPSTNFTELSKELQTDSLNVKEYVACIPVKTVAEAYHFMTCGLHITDADLRHAHAWGDEQISEGIKRFIRGKTI